MSLTILKVKYHQLKAFWQAQHGVAATEFALFAPILLAMFLGIVDIGNGLLAHKKTASAAQIAADLIARQINASTAELDDAYAAAQLALSPYLANQFGLDIASVQYVGANATPTLRWQQTYNMPAQSQATTLAAGLGVENEGVLVVTARYQFTPIFSRFIVGTKTMQEVAVIRGRRSAFIGRE